MSAAARIAELPEGQTARAFAAMAALRTHLAEASADAFAAAVDAQQRPQGYRLVAALSDDEVVAVAGFRRQAMLAHGDLLYVDDLSTLPAARGRGHARALLDWIVDEARRLGCDGVQLDSGYGPERADAHRLYLNAGFRLASHHFALTLRPR